MILQEKEILAFVGAAVRSVWTLELLILMRGGGERAWRVDELVRQLRASTKVVQQSLAALQTAGLVTAGDGETFCYRPASPQMDAYAEGAQALYREKPVTVINAIAMAPDEKLRIFSEAFRLVDKE